MKHATDTVDPQSSVRAISFQSSQVRLDPNTCKILNREGFSEDPEICVNTFVIQRIREYSYTHIFVFSNIGPLSSLSRVNVFSLKGYDNDICVAGHGGQNPCKEPSDESNVLRRCGQVFCELTAYIGIYGQDCSLLKVC